MGIWIMSRKCALKCALYNMFDSLIQIPYDPPRVSSYTAKTHLCTDITSTYYNENVQDARAQVLISLCHWGQLTANQNYFHTYQPIKIAFRSYISFIALSRRLFSIKNNKFPSFLVSLLEVMRRLCYTSMCNEQVKLAQKIEAIKA